MDRSEEIDFHKSLWIQIVFRFTLGAPLLHFGGLKVLHFGGLSLYHIVQAYNLHNIADQIQIVENVLRSYDPGLFAYAMSIRPPLP